MAERCLAGAVEDSFFGAENDISGPLRPSLTKCRARTEVTKLVYIGGYGHSGTTLLEYLMTGSPAVIACGEVGSSRGGRVTARKKCSRWPRPV